MVLSSDFSNASLYVIPWIAFLAGIGGSLHCLGMCGGLASACASDRTSNMTYQLGRLISYSIIGFIAGIFGHLFKGLNAHPFITVIPAFLIGIMFIFWGIQAWRGKSTEITVPSFLKPITSKLYGKTLKSASPFIKSFGVGFLSIFLPCGLLYGVVLSIATFQNPIIGMVGMAFFWLGTVPAMALAPEAFQRILRPLLKNSPRMMSVLLMSLGFLTISYRLAIWYGTDGQSCH